MCAAVEHGDVGAYRVRCGWVVGGFLREPYGVPPFSKLYETGTYDEGCGQSLDMVETEWRASLQRR